VSRSLLAPRPFKPGIALPLSLGLHTAIAVAILLAAKFSPDSGPMIDPDEVLMEVSMLAMPKQTTAMPQKAERAPTPVKGTSEPLPVEPIKTTSDLIDPTLPPPEVKGQDVKEDPDREKALRDMRRAEAMANLQPDAPLGTQDRARTSPDGVEGATGSSAGSVGDPVLAAWHEQIKGAVFPNFKPIQTDKGLEVILAVTIDRQGNIVGTSVRKSSGNVSFDAAARRALDKTGAVPPAPPELMRKDKVTLPLSFTPKDAA
jgi:TonB family protein